MRPSVGMQKVPDIFQGVTAPWDASRYNMNLSKFLYSSMAEGRRRGRLRRLLSHFCRQT